MSDNLKIIADKFLSSDNIYILTHKSPDGDTLGSAFALYYALKAKGKSVRVLCADTFPKKFGYMYEAYEDKDFEPKLIASVDVADLNLLGNLSDIYAQKIDICIDHHKSNKIEAPLKYVSVASAATCEIIYTLLGYMNTEFTPLVCDCLYTGISTDTGCFKFSNTTPITHKIAAELMEYGCDYVNINKIMFDTKSKARIEMERMVIDTMQFEYDDRVAIIVVTRQMLTNTGMDESDLDGVAAIPRQIEGVDVGITMKETIDGGYKISVRTSESVDASKICAALGGGGHARAAGCSVNMSSQEAKEAILKAIKPLI